MNIENNLNMLRNAQTNFPKKSNTVMHQRQVRNAAQHIYFDSSTNNNNEKRKTETSTESAIAHYRDRRPRSVIHGAENDLGSVKNFVSTLIKKSHF